MRYFVAMDPFVPILLALAATLPSVAPTAAPGATRERGALQRVTVSARIIRTAARVGAGLGPPARDMVPRRTTVSAADGRAVPALVYDFE